MNPHSDTLDIQPLAPGGAAFGVSRAQTTESNSATTSESNAVAAARARIASLQDPHQGYLEPNQVVSLRTSQKIEVGGGLPPIAAPVSPAAEARPAEPRHVPKLPKFPSAAKQKIPSATKPFISAVGSFVLLLVIFKSQIIFSQLNYLASKPKPAAAITASTTQAISADPTISIPKINVNAPVVYESSVDEAAVLKALENGVVHYGTSALPGQTGNMVIVGHSSNDWWEPGNYKFVFVLLDKLVVGDEFSLNYQSHQYVYKVTNVEVVAPTDLSVLAPTPGPTATLITCTPPGTSWKRLVIQAAQISPAPQAATPAVIDITGSSDQPAQLPGNAPTLTNQLARAWQNITSGIAGLFGHKQAATQPTTTTTSVSPTPAPAGSGATLPGAD